MENKIGMDNFDQNKWDCWIARLTRRSNADGLGLDGWSRVALVNLSSAILSVLFLTSTAFAEDCNSFEDCMKIYNTGELVSTVVPSTVTDKRTQTILRAIGYKLDEISKKLDEKDKNPIDVMIGKKK